ncbi:MAG: Uncharacterised protein [Cryomorphaceae bacterium]|nr:MAG: Uncharacterised protein [Cryomorphaceae bacterium]
MRHHVAQALFKGVFGKDGVRVEDQGVGSLGQGEALVVGFSEADVGRIGDPNGLWETC